jgi:2-dehydropantoate 2-reductase
MTGVRYVVLGAGAIGGVVGGRLFQAGFEVTLIARGQHLELLRSHGLRLESPTEAVTLPIPAVGHPGELDWQPGTTVLLAVKSQQTQVVVDDLVATAPPSTPIVSLQNGIANEPALLRFFPRVYGVCVMCPASHLQPGVVQAWSDPTTGLLDIGCYPYGTDSVSQEISSDLSHSRFESVGRSAIGRWKNRKLILNLGNVVEALCEPGDDGRPTLVGRLVAEGESALAAAGLDVATKEEDRARRADHLRIGAIDGRTREGGSSWQSLRRRTGDIETDYLNGEIVRLGRMHGTPTPANALLQTLARRAASARTEPATVAAGTILAELDHEG